MAFAFKQIEAHDPNNPGLVAPNAMVTIFEPGDPAMTPLTLTTLTGQALANPVKVNGLGYGPAFMHATLSQVAWAGGGLTGTFESYEGMRDEAIAARDAANTAAANAAAEAAIAIGDATVAAEAAADAADASALAAANSAALVGAPADTAIATAIEASGSATKAALSATIATAVTDPMGVVANREYKPAFTIAPLPGTLDNRRSNNVMSQVQDPVVTKDGVQYAIWSNDQRHPIVGKRTLPDGKWQTADLNSGIVTGGFVGGIETTTALDEHNGYAIAVDGAGRIHVSGNMHGDWLRYAVSTNPGDITAWQGRTMIGTATSPDSATERLVSYPRFVMLDDGRLLFTYRNGASGNGNQYVNRYDPATGQWTRLSTLLDGVSGNESAYVFHVAYRDGVVGMAYAWRPNGGGTLDTNDVCYIQSADNGTTWTAVNTASPLTLPITHASSPLAYATADNGSGINSSMGCDIDADGHPHISQSNYVGGIKNLIHIWHNGTTWQSEQVTQWTEPGEFKFVPGPQVFCPDNGRTYFIVNYFYEGWGDAIYCLDVTPGETRRKFKLLDLNLRSATIKFDTKALRDTNTLNMFISPSADYDPPALPYYGTDALWNKQWGAIISLDCDQIDAVQAGKTSRPHIRTIAAAQVPNGTAVTATTPTQVTGSVPVITSAEYQFKPLMARLSSRAAAPAGGTMTLQIQEITDSRDSSASRIAWDLPFTVTSSNILGTPWCPLTVGPVRAAADAQLAVFGSVTTGSGTIRGAVAEYGILEV